MQGSAVRRPVLLMRRRKHRLGMYDRWRSSPVLLMRNTGNTDWVCMIDGGVPSHHQLASAFHQMTRRQHACISALHVAGHDLQLTILCSDVHSPSQTSHLPVTTTSASGTLEHQHQAHTAVIVSMAKKSHPTANSSAWRRVFTDNKLAPIRD